MKEPADSHQRACSHALAKDRLGLVVLVLVEVVV